MIFWIGIIQLNTFTINPVNVLNQENSVNVIEIDNDPMHVYVGQTKYPLEKRLLQHQYKYNPGFH